MVAPVSLAEQKRATEKRMASFDQLPPEVQLLVRKFGSVAEDLWRNHGVYVRDLEKRTKEHRAAMWANTYGRPYPGEIKPVEKIERVTRSQINHAVASIGAIAGCAAGFQLG